MSRIWNNSLLSWRAKIYFTLKANGQGHRHKRADATVWQVSKNKIKLSQKLVIKTLQSLKKITYPKRESVFVSLEVSSCLQGHFQVCKGAVAGVPLLPCNYESDGDFFLPLYSPGSFPAVTFETSSVSGKYKEWCKVMSCPEPESPKRQRIPGLAYSLGIVCLCIISHSSLPRLLLLSCRDVCFKMW